MIIHRLRRVASRGAKLARIVMCCRYRRALRQGVAAAVEHERVQLPVEPATVLDVGANRGQFAVVAAHRWPSARLICFEPLPAAAERLTAVLTSVPSAEIHTLALTDTPGQADLHVARADDSSSLLPISDRQVTTFPGTDEVGVIAIRTARLDEELDIPALERPVLLKIDVQGGELELLRGAAAALDHIDAVLVECSFVEFYEGQPLAKEVVGFLAEHGFGLFGTGIPTTDRNGSVVQIDLVFGRDVG